MGFTDAVMPSGQIFLPHDTLTCNASVRELDLVVFTHTFTPPGLRARLLSCLAAAI